MKNGRDETVIDVDDGKKSKECIFRVPRVLRRQKPEAYTPDVVSIGPFHHPGKRGKRKGHFKLMERVKQRYLNEILSHMGNISLKDLTAIVTDELSEEGGGFENRARGFYAEPLDHISSDDFKEMMIVDGCFLIQLFRKCNDENPKKGNDPVFNMDCMFHFLCHDIVLLENQLPWFVLTTLYRLTHHKYPDQEQKPALSALVLEAFSKLPSLKDSCSSKFNGDDHFLHILDLIRSSMVDAEYKSDGKAEAKFDPDQHQMRTATALSKADIKFRNPKKDKKDIKHKKEGIMDIKFEEGGFWRNGVLYIPQLNVGILSLTLFRNLIAIEQCYHGYSNKITSYAILMDNLISSQEDMELLCKAKVIGNWLSDEDGRNFFNNLHKDIPHTNFYYKDLCKRVNKRYKLRRYTWLALLKIEKFSNPWKILAFGFAIVAVFLSSWASINNIRRHM
ncbi:hypothetical protein M0R45_018170 [Rubus argutus]|uniref:Uncharacterized protein n=1 Tax=Rubus argutus TaxID=59490 RepID=A0AAW1X1L5_RUBAR